MTDKRRVVDEQVFGHFITFSCGHRRRLLVVSVVIFVLIILMVVFLRGQPLSPTEKRLIGTWRNSVTNVTFTFHPDRSVSRPGVRLPHKWSVSKGTLYTQNPVNTVKQIFRQGGDTSMRITFDDDDNITAVYPLNGGTAYWQQVPRGPGTP